jgi:cysteine desulfurase/selenocysteine lyase
MYLSKENIKNLTPMILGGGTVQDVSVEGHKLQSTVDKWEAGTPNII